MIKTDKTIIHISMKRSGCNAISRFMYNLYDGVKLVTTGKRIKFCKSREIAEFLDREIYLYNPYNYEIVNDRPRYISIDRPEGVDLIILRYEDISIDGDYFYNHNICNWNKIVGQCDNVSYVLSIRDPFNMMASVISHKILREKDNYDLIKKRKKKIKLSKNLLLRLSRWKQHAKEFLGDTDYLPSNKLFINYNKWVRDEDYRIKTASKFNDSYISNSKWCEVAPEGGGSSFDRMNNKNVSYEDVCSRWKKCVEDKYKFNIFKSIFEDKEIIELSDRIFGHIEGTECFYE